MRAMLALTALASLLLAGPGVARADTGAIEINSDCAAVGCFPNDAPGYPVSIYAPGHYVLTSDLAVTAPQQPIGLDIQVGNVDIDFGGHTLSGGGSCTGLPATGCSGGTVAFGVDVESAAGNATVRLHNGTIRGATAYAISLGASSPSTIIDHMVLAENSQNGIYLGGGPGVVRISDSIIERNGGDGITWSGGLTPIVIDRSEFIGNNGNGVNLPVSSVVTNSRFISNASFGIFAVSRTAVGQNTFSGNNGATPAMPTIAQWNIGTVRDMGGNVCLDDGTCP